MLRLLIGLSWMSSQTSRPSFLYPLFRAEYRFDRWIARINPCSKHRPSYFIKCSKLQMPRPTKFAFIANISLTPLFLNICSALADRADFQAKLIFFKPLPVKRMAMVISGCQGVAWLETQVPLNLTTNESKLEQYCRAVFGCLQSIPKKGSTSSTAHLLVPITINKPLLPNPSKTTSEIYNVRVFVVVFFHTFLHSE